MPTTCKNKVIEHGFKYMDSTVKEITDFFETRVENFFINQQSGNIVFCMASATILQTIAKILGLYWKAIGKEIKACAQGKKELKALM